MGWLRLTIVVRRSPSRQMGQRLPLDLHTVVQTVAVYVYFISIDSGVEKGFIQRMLGASSIRSFDFHRGHHTCTVFPSILAPIFVLFLTFFVPEVFISFAVVPLREVCHIMKKRECTAFEHSSNDQHCVVMDTMAVLRGI